MQIKIECSTGQNLTHEDAEQIKVLAKALLSIVDISRPTQEPVLEDFDKPDGPMTPSQVMQEPVQEPEPWEEPVQAQEPMQVDKNGVKFNAQYCSAGGSTYASGDKKGQWKKRRGVSEEDYENWYKVAANVHGQAQAQEPMPVSMQEPMPVSMQEPASAVDAASILAPQAESSELAPADLGTLMRWVAEYQSAGKLPLDCLAKAMETLRLSLDTLRSEQNPEDVLRIYNLLKIQVGKI